MEKIILETIRSINSETKPGNDAISFGRMKQLKVQFLVFLMKRWMEMIV